MNIVINRVVMSLSARQVHFINRSETYLGYSPHHITEAVPRSRVFAFPSAKDALIVKSTLDNLPTSKVSITKRGNYVIQTRRSGKTLSEASTQGITVELLDVVDSVILFGTYNLDVVVIGSVRAANDGIVLVAKEMQCLDRTDMDMRGFFSELYNC